MAVFAENLRGALLMTGSMAAFTLNDACIKAASMELPLFQMLAIRGLASTVLLLGLAWMLGMLRMRIGRADWVWIGLRTTSEVAAAYFFLTALVHIPIADATAILQALPLAVTLAGALFLGEAVGWRRLVAILVGFFGVLLIVRPGTDGMDIYALYALAAVLCVTARDLTTRMISSSVPSLSVALIGSAGVALAAGLGASFEPWVAVSARSGWLLAGSVAMIILAYLFSVKVMRVGDIAFVAPFRYTSLVWALVLGLLVFGEFPDPITLAGAGIIAATGLFTLWREQHMARLAKG